MNNFCFKIELFQLIIFFHIFYLQKGIYPDLLATSGDYLRVWHQNPDGESRMACLLNNVSLVLTT